MGKEHTKAVGIGTDLLDVLGIQAWTAFTWRVVVSRAAIFGLVILRAGREAWIELGSLDVVVGIRIDAIAGLIGWRLL